MYLTEWFLDFICGADNHNYRLRNKLTIDDMEAYIIWLSVYTPNRAFDNRIELSEYGRGENQIESKYN